MTAASGRRPYPDVLLFIDGQWRQAASGKTIPVLNPATEEVIGTVAHAEIADLDDALAAAERGFRIWREVAPFDRAKGLAVQRRSRAQGLLGPDI